MLASTVVSRVTSLAATIVLGWLLDDHEWGLYGLAAAAAGLVGVARDGGARQILLQRQGEYEQLVGPVYWFASTLNLAAAILLCLLSPLVGWFSHEPDAVLLMLIIAASLPLTTPGLLMEVRLQMQMRFRAAGVVLCVSSVVRFGGAILLACLGVGPASFVIPVVACAVAEWIVTWWYTREKLWSRPARTDLWPGLFRGASWILLGGFGIVLVNLGGNLAIKPFVATEIVGAYFFAFQIVVQVGIVVGANLNSVLFAALAKLVNEPARFASAALRSLRPTMTLGTVLSLGLAVTFPAIEAIVWQGKKDNSVDAVLIQGITYPFAVMLVVPLSIQQARGHFRHWAMGLLGIATCILGASAFGAWLHGTPAGISAWAGGAGTLVRIAYAVIGLRRIGVRARSTLGAILPVWIVGLACGLFAFWIDLRLATPSPGVIPTLVPEHLRVPAWHVLRLLATGTTFSFAFAVAARLLLRENVLDTLAVCPRRIRRIGEAIMRVRSVGP